MKRFSKLWISGLGALALGASATYAVAKTQSRTPRPNFEMLDANGDGLISPAEMTAFAKARFDAVDTNGDGVISAAEMSARMSAKFAERLPQRVELAIARRDTNGDGELSMDEMGPKNGQARLFERLDKNGDGAISVREFAAAKRFGHSKRRGKDHRAKGGTDAPMGAPVDGSNP